MHWHVPLSNGEALPMARNKAWRRSAEAHGHEKQHQEQLVPRSSMHLYLGRGLFPRGGKKFRQLKCERTCAFPSIVDSKFVSYQVQCQYHTRWSLLSSGSAPSIPENMERRAFATK